jgi:ATP-dependent DNA helicase DinG
MAQLRFDEAKVETILGPGGLVQELHPSYEPRQPQIELSKLFEKAIASRQNAVTEAETGTGKSFAYLIPAIIAALRDDAVVIVSVPDKNLQNQLITKDIPFLVDLFKKLGRVVRFTLMKGRRNFVCLERMDTIKGVGELNDAMAMPELQFRTPEAAEFWERYEKWASSTEEGDIDEAPFEVPYELRSETTVDADNCLGKRCDFYDSCFVERRKARANASHVIVVNHALLLRDLQVRASSGGMASVIPLPKGKQAIVVVDEAHVLEDQATEAFTLDATVGRFFWLHNRIRSLTVGYKNSGDVDQEEAHEWASMVKDVLDNGLAYLKQWEGKLDAKPGPADMPKTILINDELAGAKKLLAALDYLTVELGKAERVPKWLSEKEALVWDKLASSAAKLMRDLEYIVTPEPKGQHGWVRYAEKSGRVALLAKPIDVSNMLRRRLWGAFPSVLATSATLVVNNSFETWKERVGVKDALQIVVKSPFDYQRHARIYIPRDYKPLDPSPYHNDDDGKKAYFERLANEVEALVDASDGGAFILFTSRKALDAVYNILLPRMVDRWPLFYHSATANRGQLVRDFKTVDNGVLFGLSSFWQGVDVQGSSLRLVAIDKIPFPAPGDPVWDARCQAIVEKTGNKWSWFSKLSLPQAITQLRQGAGRLIRKGGSDTEHDYGVIALLDGRMGYKSYNIEIINSLPECPRIRTHSDVQSFYAERRAAVTA